MRVFSRCRDKCNRCGREQTELKPTQFKLIKTCSWHHQDTKIGKGCRVFFWLCHIDLFSNTSHITQLFYTQIWWSKILFLNFKWYIFKFKCSAKKFRISIKVTSILLALRVSVIWSYIANLNGYYINAITAIPPGCFHLGVYLNCLVSRQPRASAKLLLTIWK